MRLVGKRVERLNKYGDDLCIVLKDQGKMKMSPALVSRLGVRKDHNKIGFAYPESGDEHQDAMVYVAPDGNGVAVNTTGNMNNMPHNRDLRSQYNLPSTGEAKLFVCEEYTEVDGFEGYKFFRVKSKQQVENETCEEIQPDCNESVENFVSSQTDTDVTEHAANDIPEENVAELVTEEVETTSDNEESFDVW